ncbi:hypothetical protein GEMRC1_004945 [Eukaryota sp. GEM-RC1]
MSYDPAEASRLLTDRFATFLSQSLQKKNAVQYRHSITTENRVILIQTKEVLYAIGAKFGKFENVGQKLHAAHAVATKFLAECGIELKIHIIVLVHASYISYETFARPNTEVQVLPVLHPAKFFGGKISDTDIDQSFTNLCRACEENGNSFFNLFWQAVLAGAVIAAICFL